MPQPTRGRPQSDCSVSERATRGHCASRTATTTVRLLAGASAPSYLLADVVEGLVGLRQDGVVSQRGEVGGDLG